MQRRSFLNAAAAAGLSGLAGCATTAVPSKARVVVIGGGYGGATAARYVRLLSDHKIDVVLVDQPERGVIGIGEPPAVATAAAINLDRIVAWLDQRPRAQTRTSRFAALAPVSALHPGEVAA